MSRSSPDRLRVPEALWTGLARLNVDRVQVVERARLPLSVLRDNRLVSTAQLFEVWRAIESVSGERTIGLRLATVLEEAVLPVAFLAAYHARDFRDALQRVTRFKRLCAPEDIQLVENDTSGTLTIDWPYAEGAAVPPALVDATMASLVELGRRGTGSRVVALKVELARPHPGRSANEEASTYQEYFGAPVRFRASADQLSFRREELDRRFPTYNQELLDALLPELDRRLERQLLAGSVADQAKWVLRRHLMAGRRDIRAVATELAMSERSLQRRLTEEGRTFQALLSETRHELALEFLANPKLTQAEVAYMLGYDDQSSFFRSFRRWEDCTPSEWRNARRAST